jgi:acetyl esterase/lipase
MTGRRTPHNAADGREGSRQLAMIRIAAALLGATFMIPALAMAQMPPDIVAKVAALGRVVDPENTAKIYAPLQEKEPYAGIKAVRDVAYGAHPRQVVDIFTPEGGAASRAVLMFVHGGGYVRGNKRPPGSAFYDNIMVFAARHGMVGVNVEYRLAPEFPWPAGVEDMAAAVRFVNDNIARYGGDPGRVFLMGHSAGAGHVAAYVSHPEFHGSGGAGIAGAIFSSGPSYVIKTEEAAESTLAYFGTDTARYAERSALPGLVKTAIPFMMSAAELDPPPIAEQSAFLSEAMCKSARGCVRSIVLPKHNHMSESYSINTADTQLSNQILEFIRTGK